MNKEKISSQEIIDLVASKASVSKRAAEEFLKVMIASVEEALLAGESVKIKNFGTFKLQWNEPRKSVNVQTGEEIVLSGYHKVSFTPDATLKELVNEPFAHLEPVQLDGSTQLDEESDKQEDELPDPLRIFTEQASEIKSLISEIQALSAVTSKDSDELADVDTDEEMEDVVGMVEVEDELEDKLEDEPEEQQIPEMPELVSSEMGAEVEEEEIVEPINDNLQEEEKPLVIEVETKSEPEEVGAIVEELLLREEQRKEQTEPQPIVATVANQIPEIEPEQKTPFSKEVKPRRKSKVGRVVLFVFLMFIAITTGFYFLYPPATDAIEAGASSIAKAVQSCKESAFVYNVKATVRNWFTPDVQPQPEVAPVVVLPDTILVDTVEVEVDSLQLMFDNPRVYNEFMASERIVSGSRLARMAQRYYGTSDFWVYIYEANKENIPNPDNIMAGTLIRIPKLDPRLIDADNPRCIQKAKELHDIYVSK